MRGVHIVGNACDPPRVSGHRCVVEEANAIRRVGRDGVGRRRRMNRHLERSHLIGEPDEHADERDLRHLHARLEHEFTHVRFPVQSLVELHTRHRHRGRGVADDADGDATVAGRHRPVNGLAVRAFA